MYTLFSEMEKDYKVFPKETEKEVEERFKEFNDNYYESSNSISVNKKYYGTVEETNVGR